MYGHIEEAKDLVEHMKILRDMQSQNLNNHSKTGLMRMINQRRSLLAYIKKTNKESYDSLIDKLGIRK